MSETIKSANPFNPMFTRDSLSTNDVKILTEDWKDWNGGECPVAKNTLVDVKVRDGRAFNGVGAVVLDWKNRFLRNDIVAYRISQLDDKPFIPPTPAKPTDQEDTGPWFALWVGGIFTKAFLLSSLYSFYTREMEFAIFMLVFACFAKLNVMELKKS